MRHFNAKIRAVKKYSAGIREEKQLTARISLANKLGELKVKFANNSALNGVVSKLPVAIGEGIKRLSARYDFLKVISRIFFKRDSRAIAARAVDVTVERETRSDNETSLNQANAEEVKVNRSIVVARLRGLVAYKRAPLYYDRESFIAHVVNLFRADGKVVNIFRRIKSAVVASGILAKAANPKSRDYRLKTEVEAFGGAAPTSIAHSETEFYSAKESEANTAETTLLNISSTFREAAVAGLNTWFLSEFEDGILTIYQIFSGVQVGDRVEIDLEADSAYWANATVNDGVLNLVFVESVTPNNNTLEVI